MSTREDILSLATKLWSVYPREVQDSGLTRPEWYAREIERFLDAAPTPPAAGAPGQEPVARQHRSRVAMMWGGKVILPIEWGEWSDWREGPAPMANGDYYQAEERPLYAAPPTYADAEAKGLKELQAWVMAERLALVPLEPDFLPKYSTLKAVGKKIRDMLAIRSPASPAPKEPGQ